MAGAAKQALYEPYVDGDEDMDAENELRNNLNRAVRALRLKALQLRRLAGPLRRECSETADLAAQCEDAVKDI